MSSPWKDPERVKRFLSVTRAAIPMAVQQLQVMAFVIGRAVPEVRVFLDVGSGSGILSQVMQEQYPTAKAVLVDYSEPLMEVARQQFTREQAVIIPHDLNQREWKSQVAAFGPFDAVVSGYAIHHLSDARKQALYGDIFDLLRPGGIFVNVEHVASPSAWVEDLFIQSFADNLYEAVQHEGFTHAQIVERLHEDDGDIVAPVEQQCDWLRRIGFANVDCFMKIYAFAVFGGTKPLH